MEVYDDENSIIGFPVVSDTTFELRELVGRFGLRAKNAQSGAGNRFVFSYQNKWCAVVRSRGDSFRLIGRCPDIQAFSPIKHTIDYDVFYVGTLSECSLRFVSLCLACLPFSLRMELAL